jgi:hypothetical protein
MPWTACVSVWVGVCVYLAMSVWVGWSLDLLEKLPR